MKGTGMFQRACYKSGKYLKNHSPTILSFIGAIGVIGTAVLAVKATPKAIKRLERAILAWRAPWTEEPGGL